jgi:hypothetical protein
MHPIARRLRIPISPPSVLWRDPNGLCLKGVRCEVDLREEFRWKFPPPVGKL